MLKINRQNYLFFQSNHVAVSNKFRKNKFPFLKLNLKLKKGLTVLTPIKRPELLFIPKKSNTIFFPKSKINFTKIK